MKQITIDATTWLQVYSLMKNLVSWTIGSIHCTSCIKMDVACGATGYGLGTKS